MFGSLRDIHVEIKVFRRRPGGQYHPELLLYFMLRNFAANKGADAVGSLKVTLSHKRSHRLAQRHITDAELFGHDPLRRKQRAARIVSDPDLPQNLLSNLIYLTGTHIA